MRREEAVGGWRSAFGVWSSAPEALVGTCSRAIRRVCPIRHYQIGQPPADPLLDYLASWTTTPDRTEARPGARPSASGAERRTPNSEPPPPSVPFRAVWRILATPHSSELLIGRNVDLVSLRRHAKSQLAISWASCMLKFTTGHF